MKNLLMLVVLVCMSVNLQAQDKKNKNLKYTTTVNGNCDQCKKRIEKAAFDVPGVKTANWNIETHELYVILNEQKSSPLDVKKSIAKQGHDTDAVKASTQDYENLHTCCKYVREE